MPIIIVRGNENNRWKKKGKQKKNKQKDKEQKNQRQKETREGRSYSERVRAKWFFVHLRFFPINR